MTLIYHFTDYVPILFPGNNLIKTTMGIQFVLILVLYTNMS